MLTLIILAVCLCAAFARRMSAEDCDWQFVEQPLSHFAKGVAASQTYQQRLCVYDKYWKKDSGLPVLFYTGNESPVEEYVKNSGFQWQLAKELNALVVFAEHRYFGESIPDISGVENCLAYLSSEEALADYASVINKMRRSWGAKDSAFIAFGGSYGGMLSSWLRIMYPSAVDGAIAASAPILGFPLDGGPLDSSTRPVTYAASADAGATPRCADNLKTAWVLLSDAATTSDGRQAINKNMNLCDPLESTRDSSTLLEYLQAPLFDLAEGSYPFPSDYITFALTGSDAPLPPWAMQELCKPIGDDFGFTISGQPKNVQFSVQSADQSVSINVEWDTTSNNAYTVADLEASGALDLLAGVAKGSQVWYNVTGTAPHCINWKASAAPNISGAHVSLPRVMRKSTLAAKAVHNNNNNMKHKDSNDTIIKENIGVTSDGSTNNVCTAEKSDIDVATAWATLNCNEGLNLVNVAVRGVGNDLYWPPNVKQGYTRADVVNRSLDFCKAFKTMGLYGFPAKPDAWAEWLDTAYGGTRLQYATNIYYSNGNLDPWSLAGVPPTEVDVSDDGSAIVSRTIDMGGHHLDLFWETEADPDSVRAVRLEEREHILKWMRQVEERVVVRK